jgi:hypothetical protein
MVLSVVQDAKRVSPESSSDYRKRKARQAVLEEQLRGMIDQDVIGQVEAEGWITPIGRLFKSGCCMMERLQKERQEREEEVRGRKRARIDDDNGQGRRIPTENKKLKTIVEQMKDVLEQAG